MSHHSFSTVLIANRGEIAVRIVRAARAAGLRSVAIFSDADRDAQHVREADTAVRIGPAEAAQSYLSIDAVIDAALRSGAEAVHPGYGFLSERSAFARAVTEAGLVFIGPDAGVMDAMGRKDHAREIAVHAGVPVVPRFDEDGAEPDAADYPVLVKAAAGGGGKGMRVVRAPGDLPEAVAAAKREAASAFGDDTLLIEKYVERGRHIEVQVIADRHGNVLHLYERDCSTQRRHQKVLEEAPAPTIPAAVRETVTASAVALCRAVGYVGAGTVEFLVWGENAAFLEMNTRLQVEHPVTELVTGLDLVALQFSVAAGEVLPMSQADVACTGHAIEARVYAEDPYHDFLPQAGIAELVRWPSPDRARVDEALRSGQEVGTAYDPMLAKIIVHGPTREAARRNLVAALDETAVLGLTTNVGFLRRLAASDAFRDAEIHTAWLDADPGGLTTREAMPASVLPIAAWAVARVSVPREGGHPFGTADGWRLAGAPAPVPVELAYDGETVTTYVDPISGVVTTADGRSTRIGLVERALSPSGQVERVRLDVDGVTLDTTMLVHAHSITVTLRGHPWTFQRPDAFGPGAADDAGDADVPAPMPGTVLSVGVEVGSNVKQGDVLGVLEAMKMELALKAPYDGVVSLVHAEAGSQVTLGEVLFRVDAATVEAW
ncbi:acetyl/propionyl/methylcrotonyl-CoA carboxylase subunit alpha [Solicola gregarius]|uniref:biotin carboxylase n=1 Tax=Solicola gregarius TaxID=2908642 RepID=A0AA46YPE8_9ACTN|nr:biotin carboxylase N-terminal domain-containing protein [Solicola gregarius]UYM07543.1 ATP-grasp domain-containing protein [Solicola gregarius]